MSVNEKMTALADAIREKSGVTGKLTIDGMTSAVKAISSLIVASASGNPIVLNDSTDLRVQSLRLFGKTTQNGTPTPAAPVPLVSAGDGGSLGVTVAGKNLLSNNVTSGTINGVTFTVNADGSVTMNGTATADVSIPIFGNNWNDTSKKLILDGNIDYILSKGTANAVVYARDAISNRNFETPLNSYRIIEKVDCLTYVYIRILKGKTLNNETIYPMIRLASIADDIYEPYKQPQTLNLSTPNGLPGIPVTSGGNYTDETGQQWLCDEVDFTRGVYVQRIGKKTFSNSKWAMNGTVDGNNWRFGISSGLKSSKLRALSTHFQMADSVAQAHGNGSGILWYTNGYVEVVSPTHKTEDEFNAWNSENSFDVLYSLSTPIETALSAEELAAYAALHTNYPNTTILNNGGAGMEVQYVADTKLYIDNKINAMAAAIVNA